MYLSEGWTLISSTIFLVGKCNILSVICRIPLEHQISFITTFARIRLPIIYTPAEKCKTETVLKMLDKKIAKHIAKKLYRITRNMEMHKKVIRETHL